MATVLATEHLTLGALPAPGGIRFRTLAPAGADVTLVLHDGSAAGTHPMPRDGQGVCDRIVKGAAAGDRYTYRMGTGDERPDPASRYQPDGVHGPSQVIDPAAFAWNDGRWGGRGARDLVIYELHVGTFSPEGTFAGATARLEALRDLGITAVELMPLADFPGARNWGYDGVCLYAPSRAYGPPDHLRRLVDRAHHLGLSVMLDVVYNHLGPEGAYIPEFYPGYFTDRHATPWGRAVNFDGADGAMVRRFIVDNARYWIREYHVDGLRLDATHALIEEDAGAIVREIAHAARAESPRPVFIHAEDHRNLASMVEDAARGGWGLDGVWADDFHHVMRRLLAGDEHGYYADFQGTTEELARTIRSGWLFTGQMSVHQQANRGTDPALVPMNRFVVCLQNHDQIGNRAVGDRLHQAIAPEAWRAASTVLLTAPMTPLLFMGQEWAATSPFLYFTDVEAGLGELVTEGRRREFADFPEFSHAEARTRIPDPQSPETYAASRLNWAERGATAHAAVHALYRALLALRLDHPALGASTDTAGDAEAPDGSSIVIRRAEDGQIFWIAARLKGAGPVDLAPLADARGEGDGEWTVVLSTEEPLYAPDPAPPQIDHASRGPVLHFRRPGAVIFQKA
ncbi:MAG: malto-oligosyltrehalose trehalohydrolase [Acidobacteriota bacterium]|nr:malto-oligosyltrehalose trehalohydrolase [Acidobacteriota bacterium]